MSRWARALLPVLVVLASVVLPGIARAERRLKNYELRADLRTQPAEIELRLTYVDPELEREPSDGTNATLHGFKFVGTVEPTAVSARTPEGEELYTTTGRNNGVQKIEYDIAKTETGESTVVVSFRQQVAVAREVGAGRFATVIPWAHVWKIPVDTMQVELLFPGDAPPVVGWDCTPGGDRLTCTRTSEGAQPVIVDHDKPGLSTRIWMPLAAVGLLLVLTLLGWVWWRRQNGVLPDLDAVEGQDWQPPADLAMSPQLSPADRRAFVTRMIWLAVIFGGLFAIALFGARHGLAFLDIGIDAASVRTQLFVVLAALGVISLLALRPKVGHARALIPFAIIGAIPVAAVVINLFALIIGMFVTVFTLVFALADGSGGGGGSSSGGYSSCGAGCSSCGSSCGGGCGGGCGGCGG